MTCPISGISHHSALFNMSKLEMVHPIFWLSRQELAIIIQQFHAGLLSPDECRLLTLAVLRTLGDSGLVHFADGAGKSLRADIAAASIPRLWDLLDFISSNERNISHWGSTLEYEGYNHSIFATIVLSGENINRLAEHLNTWDDNIAEYLNHYHRMREGAKILAQRELLDRVLSIKDRHPEKFGRRLSRWAAMATSFPTAPCIIQGKTSTYSEYWQYIITCCATRKKDTKLYLIQSDDIELLMNYLIDSTAIINHSPLDLRDTNAFILLELLRDSLKDLSFIGSTDYEIAIAANTKDSYAALPLLAEPIRANYTDELSFIRAMAKYRASQAINNGVI